MIHERSVVLKILKKHSDELQAGDVLRAFDGHGTVRVYEQSEDALLVERARPGYSLTDLVLDGRDDEATDVIAGVVRRMGDSGATFPVHDIGESGLASFDRYIASGDRAIAPDLVADAHRWFRTLASTQRGVRLLHGDLHHDNVLFDSDRGWLAIDPKGVTGEVEYEVCAMLRNPWQRPDLFLPAGVIERRVARFAAALNLDYRRTLAWGFAGAVLSALWSIEDGEPVDTDTPTVQLAQMIRQSLVVSR
jgi:streptomycin 6-kinase